MAATNFTPIQLYFSTTAAAVPLAANLAQGELAINITDGKLYYEDNVGVVKLLASAAGAAGDVVGPASSTDNAVSRFDGVTGKLIQNSAVLIDDSNNVSGVVQLNATTVDATNVEATNIKAKDGTAALQIADVTGVVSVTAAPVLTALTASQAVFTNGSKALVSNAITGTGNVVMSTSATLVTPALGTPSALVGTNITGTAAGLTAGNVTTNANLTGAVTSVGNATSLGSFTSAQLATALTDETGSGAAVFATSPTLVTPALGTPASGTVTNLTGTASININGTVGATTPATGAFTTVSASGLATLTADATLTNNSAVGPILHLKRTDNATSGAARVNFETSQGTVRWQMATNQSVGLGFEINEGDATSPRLYIAPGGAATFYNGLAVTGTLSATGVSTFSAGTAALPAITTTGDTNTGFFFPAADTLGFTTGGTERMRISSAGGVGIGGTPQADVSFIVTKTITGGATTYGIAGSGTVQTDVTTAANVFFANPKTVASAFTLANLTHFNASQGTIGAGSAVTNQFGFLATNTITGATNNFGFYSDIAAGTNRYNFFANGTADNYFAGSVGIGATANASAILDVQSTTKGVRMPNMTTTQKNAIASPAAGLMVFDTTLAKLSVYSGTAWQTITSV